MGRRKIDEFKAVSDYGKIYILVVWQDFEQVEYIHGVTDEEIGPMWFKTKEGGAVNSLGSDRYQIVLTQEILTRVRKAD